MENLRKSAIIPAYNEGHTIGSVLATMVASNLLDEIIVVNDGSSDHTSQVATGIGVTVMDLPGNRGKGYAMTLGLAASSGEVVLFLDADLVGLQASHIEALLLPVTSGRADMTVGQFQSGRFWTTLSQRITPFLSGQRAVQRSKLDGMGDFSNSRFGIETLLTLHFRKNHFPTELVMLQHLTHVVKEEKLGFCKGFTSRLKMYWDILKVLIKS
jgi:glycosyltransferase involved in cell wall biosynthesis